MILGKMTFWTFDVQGVGAVLCTGSNVSLITKRVVSFASVSLDSVPMDA
jgi:hypothetical protein